MHVDENPTNVQEMPIEEWAKLNNRSLRWAQLLAKKKKISVRIKNKNVQYTVRKVVKSYFVQLDEKTRRYTRVSTCSQ